jgi:hypothetical protein
MRWGEALHPHNEFYTVFAAQQEKIATSQSCAFQAENQAQKRCAGEL